MLSELDVLKDVCARLEDAQIGYMLTGSMAMNYYAQPRMTRDIDIVVELEASDAEKLISSFEPDYFVPGDALLSALRERGMVNLLHLDSVVKVDLIVRKQVPYTGRTSSRVARGFNCRVFRHGSSAGRILFCRSSHGLGTRIQSCRCAMFETCCPRKSMRLICVSGRRR